MLRNVADFRNILVQLCASWQTSSKTIFSNFHVDDALAQGDLKQLDDRALAALILWKCCCTDGKFNNASLVFLAAVKFLKERLGDIGQQPFLDLGAMLKAGTTEDAIRKWIDTHYP